MKLPKTELIFLLSPFISLPLVLKDIYKNRTNGYLMMVLIFAIISYLYIPEHSNDKSAYFELHELFENMNFYDFFVYIKDNRVDFIFYLVIYLFSQLGFSFSFTSSIITGLTIFLFFFVLRGTLEEYKIKRQASFLFFLMIITSFSLSDLFSGMRFYLASAFILIGFYYSVIKNNITTGVIYILLASFTHFSTAIYIFVIIFYNIFKNHHQLTKVLFISSFLFLFVSREYLLNYFGLLNMNAVLSYKINSYLGENDFIEQGLESGSIGHYLIIVISDLWYFIVGAYILYNIKNKNKYMTLVMITYMINNIFYIAPNIFHRYSHITITVFILLLIHDYSQVRQRIIFRNIFSIFLSIYFILHTVPIKKNLFDSLYKLEVLSLPTIMMLDPTEGAGPIYKYY